MRLQFDMKRDGDVAEICKFLNFFVFALLLYS
jgi:hypothetical protein